MKALSKSYLLQSKYVYFIKTRDLLFILLFFFAAKNEAQIINYVNNPSFELSLPSLPFFPSDGAKYWGPIDTAKTSYFLVSKLPPLNNVPYCNFGFQFPRTGNNFIGTSFYCDPSTCPGSIRWYPRSRLKQPLKANTAYCAKYYIVNTNNCIVGIDSYGMYFGNSGMDTITNCYAPLTYLLPQVQHQGGIITDTLNWIPITGTFVANGTEKYLVLGNFKSNAATNTIIINPTYLPQLGTDIYIDDVSLIELNLPAFAGNDTSCIPGTTVYIGRPRDIGIDEACMWYKWPNITTAIDTAAGMTVSPIVTTTYVVRQEICGNVKWDTVVVYQTALGIKNEELIMKSFQIYPVPADDYLELRISNEELFKDFKTLSIYNSLGQIVREEEISFRNKTIKINTSEFSGGVYQLQLKSPSISSGQVGSLQTVSKRFVISR